LHTPKLHIKKLFAIPLMVVPLVLGFGGVALASNPTQPPPALPSDQVVLNGSCLSVTQVLAAAQQAVSFYAPGDQPAGLLVNGDWLPAAMVANSGASVGANGCVGPILPTNSPFLPTDQITVTGICPSVTQVMTAAQDAITLYAPGDAPAGVIVSGNWVPAGVASSAGGNAASGGCAVS
jgi:hypothetical protein